jgi:hypothetical protein
VIRIPFLAALILMAAAASESRAIGPRRPHGAAAPHMAAPHAAAPHVAVRHATTPSFSRPQMPRTFSRPAAPGRRFVRSRPAAPVRRPQSFATRPTLPNRPSGLAGRPTTTLHPKRPAVTIPRSPGRGLTTGPRITNGSRFGRTTVNRPTFNNPTFNRNRTTVNQNNFNVRNRSVTRNNFVAGNRWGRGGRQVGAARSWFSSPGNWGRSWWGGRPAWNWGRPWFWQHSGWHHGFWNFWSSPPAFWFGSGLAAGWLLSPGDGFAFFNPYFVTPVAAVPWYLDYAVPLPAVPADMDALAFPPDPDEMTDVNAVPTAPVEGPAAAANRLLDDARTAFQAGDYPRAEQLVEAAIAQTPSDPTLHEFRALTLFAQGNYQDAAATLYTVLTSGPGWDWATMSGLYPDVATYTAQLRALERFVGDNPTQAYGHFLLAYHYLVTQNRDAAVRELGETVRLQPNDTLSQALLTSLVNPAAAAASAPPTPGR